MVAPFDLTTIATMVIGARIGMPAFVFEHLVILFVVGLGIAAMNATAAKEVWEAARQERRDALP